MIEQQKAKGKAKSSTIDVWTQTEGRYTATGRLTPSFRTVYSEVLDDLRKEIRNWFVDLSHKEAFDLLYKEAWRPKEAAMRNSTLPTVLDKLYMVSNINARKLIELNRAEIKIKETKIQALQEMIETLEQKINVQARRLDALYSKKE